MLIDSVDDFSLWLIEELKEICDADPVTLSKYVIALLKKDKSETSLKKICIDQLNVFLVEKTKDFVTKVFECLKLKSYTKIVKIDDIVVDSCENDLSMIVEALDCNISENISSEYKIDDNLHKDVQSSDDGQDLKRFSPKIKEKTDIDDYKKNIDNRSHYKRTLEYNSSQKSVEESRKRKRYNEEGSGDSKEHRRHSSRHSRSHKSKRNVFDRIDHKIDSKLISYNEQKNSWNIKTSCPDFVEKGVCLKGDSCEFDHGTNIVRSDLNCIYSASGPNWPLQINPTWVDYPISKHNQNLVQLKNIDEKSYQSDSKRKSNINQNSDIYDPSHPEIDAINDADSRNGLNDQAPVYVPSKVESSNKDGGGTWWNEIDEASSYNNCTEGSQVTTVIGSAQSRFRRTISPVKRGRYNNNNHGDNSMNNNYNNNNYNNNNNNKFNNRRPINARCILVTHIPVECNDEMRLKQHFMAFGMITDVEVRFQNDPQHALVEFATCDEARNAFRSPLPILDNRFIRTSLFSRPNNNNGDSRNLRICKDNSGDDYNNNSNNEKRKQYSRKVVQQTITGNNDPMEDSIVVDKWPQHSQSSDDEKMVVVKETVIPVAVVTVPKRIERKFDHWPVASELKLDRRTNNNTGDGPVANIGRDEIVTVRPPLVIHQNEEKNPRLIEAQIERQKKLKAINDRKELKFRIERLEDSVQSCKNRLKTLLIEQKNPACDKDLVKKQLVESYNYFKELRDMLEPLKNKLGPQAQLTEVDKLKMKIKNIQNQLVDMEKDSEVYKKHLKMITEHKRDLVKLQSSTKNPKSNRLPSLYETKLDNRPKTLYITGSYATSHTIDDVKHVFKRYQIEKIEPSDNEVVFFAVEFKTRNEADRAVFEMNKLMKEKNMLLSFEKPIQICDPLDFKTRSDHVNTQRGTPRDNCASSDEDDESKMN